MIKFERPAAYRTLGLLMWLASAMHGKNGGQVLGKINFDNQAVLEELLS